jgi:sigma-B regulation protein RsbU (phosphoserine phosphatase)
MFSESEVSSHFVTLVCARATPLGRIELCNAGHCPPIVLRRGEVELLDSDGLPVGVVADGRYEVQSLAIEPGDTVLLYSDGVSEAMNERREQFGVERLAECVQKNGALRPAALAAACLREVDSFRDGAGVHDDTSLMVIRRSLSH